MVIIFDMIEFVLTLAPEPVASLLRAVAWLLAPSGKCPPTSTHLISKPMSYEFSLFLVCKVQRVNLL